MYIRVEALSWDVLNLFEGFFLKQSLASPIIKLYS